MLSEPVKRSDAPGAALVHDVGLAGQRPLLEAAGSAARIALENARLHAELQAQLAEVRASRARIVAAGDAERRRLERDLHDGAQQRYAPPVESAAYFVVAEARANISKHADARSAWIIIAPRDGRLIVEVRDDGRGGADAAGGSGLQGLLDRVGALDGTLSVQTDGGAGTTIRAEIPCASLSPTTPR